MNFTSSMKRFLLSLLVLMGGLGLNRASASHYAAVDLSMQFVGSDSTDLRYRLVLDIYKVCEYTNGFGNASLEDATSVCYTSASASFSNTWPLTVTSKDTLDQLCPGITVANSCRNVNGLPGFVRHRFIDTVTLPSRRTDWRFTWNNSARNAGVVNLANPDNYSIFVEAGLNNVSRFSNSTPRYTFDPLPYVCVNQPTNYVNAPIDVDNDSMRTFSIQPRDASTFNCPNVGVPIAYESGFSLANPINSAVGNPYATSIANGTATFTPTQTGKFVLAYQTVEYDRFTGVQMGYISRDAQVIVLPCSAAPPNIDTVPQNVIGGLLLGQNEVRICAGDSVSFNVTTSSNTFVNQVYLTCNNTSVSSQPIGNPDTSHFTVTGNGTSTATGTWSWRPKITSVGDHVLIFTAKDSTCNNNQPIVLRNYLIVLVKVLPNIQASRDTFFCPPNGLPAQLGVSGPTGLNLPWTWTAIPPGSTGSLSCTNCDSPFATPTVTTDYVVETTPLPSLCRFKDTVRVTVVPNNTFTAGPDQSICLNDLVQLQAQITQAPGLYYQWVPSPYLSDTTIIQPTAQPPFTTSFVLFGGDGSGCRYRDTVNVVVTGVRPLVEALAGRDTVCPNGSTQLFSTVTQQPCGLATGVCVGGTPEDKDLGTTTNTATLQSPFFTATNTGGHFVQMLYRREELVAAGVRPGYINSIGFNVVSKTSTAAFPKYTVYMGCTQETDLSAPAGASTLVPIPGIVPVYTGNYTTTAGWNTINFPVPYYWDGASNIAVQICAAKRYGLNQGTTDVVYASTPADGFTSTRYLSQTWNPNNNVDTLSFCTSTIPVAQSVSALRPNTRFNVCSGNDYNYAWTVTSPPSGVVLENAASPNAVASNLNAPTQFTLTVTAAANANCFTTDVVNVEIDRSNSVDATPNAPFVLCRPDYVQFAATGIGPRPIFNPACGIGAPITGTVDSGFVGTATTATNALLSPYFGQGNRTSRMQMLVRRSELLNAGVRPGTMRSLSFFIPGTPATGSFSNFRISLRCTDAQSLSTSEGFTPSAATVYAASSTVTTVSGWNEYTFDAPYNWDSSKNLIVEICWANSGLNSANQPVQYSDAGFPATLRSYSTTGNICAGNIAGAQTFVASQRPNMRFRFTAAGETDFQYTWTPAAYLSDSSVQNPVAYVPKTGKWYVSTVGRNNCLVSDSIEIYVPTNNFNVFPKDTIFCYGESMRYETVGGGKTYAWYENGFNAPTSLSCTDCANPIATPLTTTEYTLVIADSVNCADTFTTRIRIKPLPAVDILQGDTTIKFGQSVVLRVTGADLYYWSPALSLSAAAGTTVVAMPKETTTYVVSGIAGSGPSVGCRYIDSVTIAVDPSDNLFVPSAFSPNGDGKNDVFKVANFTFQRLMEFRIFNRYGQEIFSTTDGKRGWDGTWKGQRQDMGVYQYLIRVAFPDGTVETYKGDVTLMR